MDAARRLWTLIEPYHALVYFADEVRDAYEQLGLRGFWRGYFAGRAAPLGPVGPGVVTAVFYGFHPDFVARALPEVWSMATPEVAIEARLVGVDAAFRRIGVSELSVECEQASRLLRQAMEACSPSGRPMFAANVEAQWPDEPHLSLWHAATLLREHRGDGHVAALVAEQVGPCESHVLRVAADGSGRDTIQPHRGWSDQDWHAATQQLTARGWLERTGELTALGHERRSAVEERTDILAGGPVDRLGPRMADLTSLMRRILEPILTDGTIPYPNAMGTPPPEMRR